MPAALSLPDCAREQKARFCGLLPQRLRAAMCVVPNSAGRMTHAAELRSCSDEALANSGMISPMAGCIIPCTMLA
jgi:hypothetical protein